MLTTGEPWALPWAFVGCAVGAGFLEHHLGVHRSDVAAPRLIELCRNDLLIQFTHLRWCCLDPSGGQLSR
jgi:hypothetical protein